MTRHPETAANRQPNEKLIKARARLPSPHQAGRSMSRSELADAVNAALDELYADRASIETFYVTDRWIGNLERGEHRWASAERRAALRRATSAATDHDLGLHKPRYYERGVSVEVLQRTAPRPAQADARRLTDRFTVNRRELFTNVAVPGAAALVAAVVAPIGNIPTQRMLHHNDLDRLATRLTRIRSAYQHSQYESAAESLPTLLTLVRCHREHDQSFKLAKLDAEAHQVASALLLKSEQPVLGAIAAERSMTAARASGDELTLASSTRAVVHCLMGSGHPQPAADLAARAADQLAGAVNLDQAPAVSVYGALLLRGAIAAARMEDHDHTQTLLDEASRAAGHLGADDNLYWTAFGPTNVAAHRVAAAVELGDAGTAVRLARTIDINKLDLPERKATLLLDIARALTQWGRWQQAFEAIQGAERYAPEEVRARPVIHAMIQDLALRAPARLRAQVYEYARQIGSQA